MDRTTRLSPEQVESARTRLDSSWSVRDGRLVRDLVFGDFIDAFGFLTRLALISEDLGHYPGLFNRGNAVRITLGTEAGVTHYDLLLAGKVDLLAPPLPVASE